jgi:hypothetical protein
MVAVVFCGFDDRLVVTIDKVKTMTATTKRRIESAKVVPLGTFFDRLSAIALNLVASKAA